VDPTGGLDFYWKREKSPAPSGISVPDRPTNRVVAIWNTSSCICERVLKQAKGQRVWGFKIYFNIAAIVSACIMLIPDVDGKIMACSF
jgi:hypothetical protein